MQYSRMIRLIGALTALPLVLFACGDSVDVKVSAEPGSADIGIDAPGADIDISADDEGGAVISVATPGGEGLITAGKDVPAGFPLPIAPGCEVVSSTSVDTPDGTAISVIIEMPAAEAEAVTAFYEREFERIGMAVTQTVTSGDAGGSVMLVAAEEGGDSSGNFFLQVSGDKATATISVGSTG